MSLGSHTLVAGAALLIVTTHGLTQDEAPYPTTFEERLAKARVFKEVAFHDPIRDHAPFTIYAQKKLKEPFDPAQSAANLWRKWLAHTDRALNKLYLEPLGRAPREGFETTPLIVLASQGDYSNYLASRRSLGRYTREISDYNAALGAVVTYKGAGIAHWGTYSVLHDLVMGRLAAVADQPLAELWVFDGVATYLSYHRGFGPEAIDTRRPHRSFLEAFASLWKDKATMERYWLHPRELFAERGEAGLRAVVKLHAKEGAKLGAREIGSARYYFEAQSWLLVHWANAVDDGGKRDAFRAYLGDAIDGRGGAEKFVKAMELNSQEHLEREMRRHVMRLYQEEFRTGLPQSSKSAGPVEKEDAAPTLVEAPNPEAQRENELAAARSALAEGPANDVEALASALWLARTGQLQRAIDEIAGVDEAQDADARARLERCRERVVALLQAREAAFAQLAKEGGKLRLTVAEDKKTLRVESYEDGVLTFGRNRYGVAQRAAEEISTLEWISALGKRSSEFGPEWLRGYAMLLAENKRAKHFLKDAGPKTKAIEEDTQFDLSQLLDLGRAQTSLREISVRPISANRFEAEAMVESIRALVADAGELDPVKRRKDALRVCAREALSVLFASGGLDQVLTAQVERLDGGSVRLTYGFDDAAEEQDFLPDHDYWLKEHQRLLAGNQRDREVARPESTWGVQGGDFGGIGWACFRHKLEFEGPMRVRAKVWFTAPPAGVDYAPVLFLGVCDDGEGNFVAMSSPFGALFVFERDTHTSKGNEAGRMTVEVSYDFELQHDGKVATTFCDGKEKQSDEVRTLTSGAVFLWSHSYSRTLIRDLVIEGRPTTSSLEQLSGKWIEDQLVVLGL